MSKRRYSFYRYYLHKHDFGAAFSGAATAAAQIVAANVAADATRDAAERSYEGTVATNNANIQIANDLNSTNIQNTRETNATNIELNRQNNAANRQLAAQQNQWNIEQWERQNQYNSPANQVELYRKAGLNPASLAGAGWSDAQQLQSAPLANQVAPQIDSPQASALPSLVNPEEGAALIEMQGAAERAKYISQIAQSGADVARSVAEIQKTKSDTKLNEADIKKCNAELDFVNKQSNWYDKLSDADLSVKIETANQLRENISLLKSTNDKVKAEVDLYKFDYGLKQKFKDILEKTPEAELDRIVAQIGLFKGQTNLANSEAALNRMVQSTGTQIPTVKSPEQQMLWDIYNYLTDNGTKNIVDVLKQTFGVAAPVVKKAAKAIRTVRRHYRAITGRGPGGRSSHDPLLPNIGPKY